MTLGSCFSSPLRAAPIERENWMVEQWTRPPLPTSPGASRSQASLTAVNYTDTVSVQGSGIIDLHGLEISLRASQRMFLEYSDEGRFLAHSLSIDEKQSVGLGVSRYYVAPDSHYGRLGVEFLHSFPGYDNWIKIAVDGGMAPSLAMPWFVNINFNYLFSVANHQLVSQVPSNFISVRGTTGRSFFLSDSDSWSLSAVMWWTWRTRNVGLDPTLASQDFESMLFSLGPSFAYTSALGELRADVLFRLWLDKELFWDNSANRNILTGYPSEFGPSLALSWTYRF